MIKKKFNKKNSIFIILALMMAVFTTLVMAADTTRPTILSV